MSDCPMSVHHPLMLACGSCTYVNPGPALSEHDRQVAERAWDEGHLVHGEDYRHNGYCRDSGGCIAVNPYRKEQENTNA